MKANELRIGNLVNVPNERQCPFRIDSIEHLHPRENFGKFGMYHDELPNRHPLTWYLQDLEPIPLTEEWLLRFGFNKVEEFTFDIEILFDRILSIDFDDNYLNYSCYVGSSVEWVLISKIQHVHQLQNLYFALTGEELEINS